MEGNRTLDQIEKEISVIQDALKDVHGERTEVYARIVGYYRAVQNWNKGKRDEFNRRVLFTVPQTASPASSGTKHLTVSSSAKDFQQEQTHASMGSMMRFELYTRPSCPHCPPARDFMSTSGLSGTEINVDLEEGFALASANGVFATPTVIFYDASGQETARAHTMDELSAVTGACRTEIA